MAVDGMAVHETANHVSNTENNNYYGAPVTEQRPKQSSSTYAQDFSNHKYQKRRPPINKSSELTMPIGQMEVMSKYAEDFKAHAGHKRLNSFKPVDEIQKLGGKMQVQTTSQDAFCAKQLSPRFQRQQETYKKPETKMDCSTSYSSDFYSRNEYCKLPPIKPQERKDSAKPFIATTESREQFKLYQKNDGGKQASYKPLNQYVRPSEPFIGTSSYKGDFLQVKTDRPKPIKPQGNITGDFFSGGRITPPHQVAPPVWIHQQPLSPIASNNRAVSDENCRQEVDCSNQLDINSELISSGPQ